MTRQLENRMLVEYLFENYSDKAQWRRIRLGQVPNVEMAKAYKVVLRWADAIVFTGSTIKIIEFKIFADVRAIGQLELYKELFFKTPEFSQFWEYPVELIFVSSEEDLNLREHLENKDIEYIVWTAPWLEEYKQNVIKSRGRQ